MYLIGRAQGNRRVESVGLHSVEAILLADVLGGAIKFTVGRQRPFVDVKTPDNFQLWRGFKGDQWRSFPSGHTITAFAFASTVTRESKFWRPGATWYVGTVFYGGASLVGLSRIYNNQHWASDVMAGAAIGTLVGLKVVNYTHSNPGNRLDKALDDTLEANGNIIAGGMKKMGAERRVALRVETVVLALHPMVRLHKAVHSP